MPAPGEPLVLLPGMNCSARLWAGVAVVLRRRTAVGIGELRGRSVDACVEHLLDRLPDRFALAGLSLGGNVALALVRHAPERVRGLALLSTNPKAPTVGQRREWADTGAALAAGTSARDLQSQLLPVLLSDGARSGPLAAEVLAMADEVGEQRLADQLAVQATRTDQRPGLGAVTVPTLLVAAAADALCPIAGHEEMRALVPGAELAVLPGVGHLSALEAPAEVAGLLADWLRRQR